MVEGIEGFGAELQPGAFRIRAAEWHAERLEQREVEVGSSRAAQHASPGTAEGQGSRSCKRGGIEPLTQAVRVTDGLDKVRTGVTAPDSEIVIAQSGCHRRPGLEQGNA